MTGKITLNDSPIVNKRKGSVNVSIRRSTNVHINGSSSSVVGSSNSGVGSKILFLNVIFINIP
jgi:hypothetical protein